MWTADNRPRYNRDKLRYPSDLTDAEWAHIEPLIPPGKPGGGKRRVAIREVINGVMYILSTGCQWRALPKDLPPRSTVHDYLGLWNWDGTLDRIHHALYLKCREKAAREASPTACIIDSQSVKSAEKGGLASTATASMPASVIKGKKRHVLVDARLAAARHRHRRRRSGSRRRSRAAGDTCSAPLSREIVRRQRLSGCRSFTAPWPASCPISRPRSSSLRSGEGLRRPAQALGGRTHHRLAQAAADWPRPGRTSTATRSPFIKLASIRLMRRKLCNPTKALRADLASATARPTWRGGLRRL